MLFSCVCFMAIYELILGEGSDDVQLRLADCFILSHIISYIMRCAEISFELDSFFSGKCLCDMLRNTSLSCPGIWTNS
jgi:hypothetical protein